MRCIFYLIINVRYFVGCFKEENTLKPINTTEYFIGFELDISNG
jgi:hypothetical protein